MRAFTCLSLFLTLTLSSFAFAQAGQGAKALLSSEIEGLPLSAAAKKQAYSAMGQEDGFGLRLGDLLLTQIPNPLPEWKAFLKERRLAFGLSQEELREYMDNGLILRIQFPTPRERAAFAALSPTTKLALRRMNFPSAKSIAERFTDHSILRIKANFASRAEITAFVEKSGYSLRTTLGDAYSSQDCMGDLY